MSLSRAVVFVFLCAWSGLACGRTRGPVAPTEARLTADDETWMTLAPYGARLRAPPGWAVQAHGSELLATPRDGHAALILDGADSKPELEAKLRALGARYGLDEVELDRGRPGRLHGIPVIMFEDMATASRGKAGDVFVLLGDAPSGRGLVFVFLWAADATQSHDVELIDAANTLRPT